MVAIAVATVLQFFNCVGSIFDLPLFFGSRHWLLCLAVGLFSHLLEISQISVILMWPRIGLECFPSNLNACDLNNIDVVLGAPERGGGLSA